MFKILFIVWLIFILRAFIIIAVYGEGEGGCLLGLLLGLPLFLSPWKHLEICLWIFTIYGTIGWISISVVKATIMDVIIVLVIGILTTIVAAQSQMDAVLYTTAILYSIGTALLLFRYKKQNSL